MSTTKTSISDLLEPLPDNSEYVRLSRSAFKGETLIGPAVIAVTGDFILTGSDVKASTLDAVFTAASPGRAVPVGMILADDLSIEDCALEQISFVVAPEQLERLGTTQTLR